MAGTTLAKVILWGLLQSITPATARAINAALMELLEDLAAKTDTDLDDKLFQIFKRFLAQTEPPDHHR